MNPAKIRVVGFDCDGVLFDSAQANRAYYNDILNRFGLPELTEAQFAYAQMHTVDEAFAFLVHDAQTLADLQRYRREKSYLPFIQHMVIEPHLRALLTYLRPAYRTAIATNRTDTMARVLEIHGLQNQFDKVVTASDVAHPKPFPDQLLALLDHFNIEAGEMIFIGDSELDAAAAHQARVPFIAYRNSALAADIHIEDLGQITGLLGLEAGVSLGGDPRCPKR